MPVPPIEVIRHRAPEIVVMKIRMLTDDVGCPDGYTRTQYKEGEEYEVPEVLGNAFVNKDKPSAEEVGTARRTVGPSETKPASPGENKEDVDPEEERRERINHWPMTMPPGQYLERFPSAPKSDLARWVLGQTDEKPEPTED